MFGLLEKNKWGSFLFNVKVMNKPYIAILIETLTGIFLSSLLFIHFLGDMVNRAYLTEFETFLTILTTLTSLVIICGLAMSNRSVKRKVALSIITIYLAVIFGFFVKLSAEHTTGSSVYACAVLVCLLALFFLGGFSTKRSVINRILVTAIAAVLSIIAVSGIRTIERTMVTITATGEKNVLSDAYDINITEIGLDRKTLNPENVRAPFWKKNKDTLLYTGAKEDYKHKPSIDLFLKPHGVLKISMEKNPRSGIVEITTPKEEVTLDLYADKESSTVFEIPFASVTVKPETWGADYLRVLALLIVITNLLLDFYTYHFFKSTVQAIMEMLPSIEKIKSFAYSTIGFILGVLIIISPHLHNWDIFSKIAIVFLATFSMRKTIPLFLDGSWKIYAPTQFKRCILALIIFYAAFASVYNQIVLGMQSSNIGFHSLFLIILCVILWISLIFGFFRCIEWLRKSFTCPPRLASMSNEQQKELWLKIFLIIMSGHSFWMLAFFPANMSPDSIDQWLQAIGERPLNNWHPVIDTLLIRASIVFIKSPFMMVLSQSVAQAVIWAFAVIFLARMGVKRNMLYVTAFFIAFVPTNGVFSVTILKDTIFAISILALTICFASILQEEKLTILGRILSIISLFFVGTTRHNGIIPAVTSVFALSVLYLKKFNKLYPLMALAAIFLVHNIAYPLLNIPQNTSEMAALIPLQAIGSVFYKDGNIGKVAKEILTQHIPGKKWISDYNAYSTIGYQFGGEKPRVVSILKDIDNKTLLKIYIRLFIKNPFILIRHHLSMSDIQWAIFTNLEPERRPHHAGVYSPIPADIVQEDNALTRIGREILRIPERYFMSDALLYRGGIYIVLYLMLGYYAWIKRVWKINLVLCPIISNFLIMMPINLVQEYRYAYPSFFLFPFILLYYTCATENSINYTDERIEVCNVY
jgi:hypothetical protein